MPYQQYVRCGQAGWVGMLTYNIEFREYLQGGE